jgi:hypothetical protein
MPEKLRFDGKPVVLLLVSGGWLRGGIDGTIVQKDLKIIIVINITDEHRGEYIVCGGRFWFGWVRFSGVLMSTLQRLAAITDTTADLIAQLRELQRLRERVRKAELARRSWRADRRKRTRIRRLEPISRLHRR